MPTGETEFIPLDVLVSVTVTREQTGDYLQAAAGFFLLSILSIWFLIGWLFMAWGVAALFTKKYCYRLVITTCSGSYVIMERRSKGPVISLCRTIEGLITSRRLRRAEESLSL